MARPTPALEVISRTGASTLSDDILDRIDEIVPPGTDASALDMAYQPPAVQHADLRRRPVEERAAA